MTLSNVRSVIMGCVLATMIACSTNAAETATGFAGFMAPDNTPQVFAPGVISTDSYEFAVTFTPDMSEMYLTRRTDPGPNQIVVAGITSEGIQAPVPASFSMKGGQFEPCIAPDGEAIYFGDGDKIVVSRKVDGHWSTTEELPDEVNSGFAMAICVDANGDFYFTGSDGLMVVRNEGNGYHAAESVDPHFTRAAGGSAHGYIAPAGDCLVFDSQGRGDAKGRADLYVSFRAEGGGWTEPRNLEALNSEGTEMCASVSPDGRFLFFSRDGDIWWVDAGVLELYR